jgi:Peptidase family M23
MTTQTASVSSCRRRLTMCAAAAATVLGVLLAAPVAEATDLGRASGKKAPYAWPIKPFDRQHPVRGFFGDPRIAEGGKGTSHSFHFGIDISCPDGTPVYATLSGRVVLEAAHPETVSIVGANEDVTFAYWHVVPSVSDGQTAVAFRTVVGHVAKGWAHVHFAEMRDGIYLNPLRVGALEPYADATRPQVKSLRVERARRTLSSVPSSGTFDLVVEAYDTTPIPVAAPWHDKPVSPAVLRWRPRGSHLWRTAVDVRWTIPANTLYDRYFADWTRQNNPWGCRGRYRFFLAHDLDARAFAKVSSIEVQAIDTRGNSTTRVFALPRSDAW